MYILHAVSLIFSKLLVQPLNSEEGLSKLLLTLQQALLHGTIRCSIGGVAARHVYALHVVEAGRCPAAVSPYAMDRWRASAQHGHKVAAGALEGVPSLGGMWSVVLPLHSRSGCGRRLVCQQFSVGNDSGIRQVVSSPPR